MPEKILPLPTMEFWSGRDVQGRIGSPQRIVALVDRVLKQISLSSHSGLYSFFKMGDDKSQVLSELLDACAARHLNVDSISRWIDAPPRHGKRAEAVAKLRSVLVELRATCKREIAESGKRKNDGTRYTVASVANARAVKQRLSITKAEANLKARNCLKKRPNITARELAKEIGCSSGLISKLPAWKVVMEARSKGQKPRAPKAIAFTPKVEASTGKRDEELERLKQEQTDDDRHGHKLRNRKP